jgi:cystathionine beta-lyase/cystathionine gamma-synthase
MASPDAARETLLGERAGFAYQRDGHPNAEWLSEKISLMHGADWTRVTSSGMSALGLVLLSVLRPGDHVLLSNRLYGKTQSIIDSLHSWGVDSSHVDVSTPSAVSNAFRENTKLLVAETISNPQVRVADLAELSRLAAAHSVRLLIDNTFASPVVCRPIGLGADFVWESLTKIMNGHSDVVLGSISGRRGEESELGKALSMWGMTASPFDCWLCERGLGTLQLRAEAACTNALAVATWLSKHPNVSSIQYPGLPDHRDHQLCRRQFLSGSNGEPLFGHMLMFDVANGWEGATRLIAEASGIPFCPSLGELATTLSHPSSTSHLKHSPEAKRAVGISDGSVRLSVGIDDPSTVIGALSVALDRLGS